MIGLEYLTAALATVGAAIGIWLKIRAGAQDEDDAVTRVTKAVQEMAATTVEDATKTAALALERARAVEARLAALELLLTGLRGGILALASTWRDEAVAEYARGRGDLGQLHYRHAADLERILADHRPE